MAAKKQRSTAAPDALTHIMADVIAADPELRDEARELARDLMRSARRMMVTGTADVKMMLFKAVLPQMLKSVGSVEADEQQRREAEARRRMMLQLAGRVDEHVPEVPPAQQTVGVPTRPTPPKAVRKRA